MIRDKPILELVDFMGIPTPGQYDGLKGIELWGDGEVYDRDDTKRKKKEKKVDGNISQKVAKITARFSPTTEDAPDFLDQGKIMSYQEFIQVNGECISEEGYDIITETYRELHGIKPDDGYLFQMMEAVNHFVFNEEWFPVILENMKKPNVRNILRRVIAQFIDANSEILSKRYPSRNVMLSDADINTILQAIKFPKARMAEIVKNMLSKLDAKTEFKSITKSPHQIVFTGMLIAATQIKDERLIHDCELFCVFSMYPLIFRKYFPVTDPNEFAMEQAVLTCTKKFYIARTKSVLEWIQILIDVPYQFYKSKFLAGHVSDELYVAFLNRLRNTINQQMKSLYQIYKKAYDKQSISTMATGDFVTLGSDTDKIQIYTMGVVDKITNMGYRANVAKSAAEFTKTDPPKVDKYIREFVANYQKYDLTMMVQTILTVYFNVGRDKDFLATAIRQYPKAMNGNQPLHREMREYLIEMEKRFKQFDPEFTRRYTFAVYMYFAILINVAMNNIANRLIDISLAKLKNIANEGNDVS